MILILINLILLCIACYGLYFILKRVIQVLRGQYNTDIRKFDILLSFVLFFLPLTGFFFISYSLSIASADYTYSKKGSFVWWMSMDNEAIKTFPVIKPWKQPQYVRYGDLSAAWEIEYASKESLESIFPIIESHVRSFGFELTKSQETKCSWPSLISNENLILYTATSKNYECIDLVFDNEMQGSLKIKARISV